MVKQITKSEVKQIFEDTTGITVQAGGTNDIFINATTNLFAEGFKVNVLGAANTLNPDNMTGDVLENFAKNFGINRYQGLYGIILARVTMRQPNTSPLIGSQLISGSAVYSVNQVLSQSLLPNEFLVRAVSTTLGRISNPEPNSLLQFTDNNIATATFSSVIFSGADMETDQQLRNRLLRQSGANRVGVLQDTFLNTWGINLEVVVNTSSDKQFLDTSNFFIYPRTYTVFLDIPPTQEQAREIINSLPGLEPDSLFSSAGLTLNFTLDATLSENAISTPLEVTFTGEQSGNRTQYLYYNVKTPLFVDINFSFLNPDSATNDIRKIEELLYAYPLNTPETTVQNLMVYLNNNGVDYIKRIYFVLRNVVVENLEQSRQYSYTLNRVEIIQ